VKGRFGPILEVKKGTAEHLKVTRTLPINEKKKKKLSQNLGKKISNPP